MKASEWETTPGGERLLVCVGPSPSSEQLIQSTHRLAQAMGCEWVALNVDTGGVTPAEKVRVERHLGLVERLGGQVEVRTSYSVVDAILEGIGELSVSKIVLGRTGLSGWRAYLRQDLLSRLLDRTPEVGIFILDGDGTPLRHRPERVTPQRGSKPYLVAVAFVVLATMIGLPLRTALSPTNLVMIYLAAVVGTAYIHGRGPSNLSAVLSVVAFDFFFVPPKLTFVVDEPEYLFTFFGLLLSGLLVSRLTARAQEQAVAAKGREKEALALLSLSRELTEADSVDSLTKIAGRHLEESFGGNTLLLANDRGELDGDQTSLAAEEAFKGRRVTGTAVGAAPEHECQWHPLKSTGGHCWGVVGLEEPVILGARRREELLEAFLNHISGALERLHLSQEARDAELLRASEQLHTALLNSISHDLRIPLVSIQGALTSLDERELQLNEESRRVLIENALEETERLNRLVGNLLQMTRLESGHLSVKRLPCDLEDLVSTTLTGSPQSLESREILLELPRDLPLVPLDFVLMQQVLFNLLENAAKFSPEDSPIEITAEKCGESVLLRVLDRGTGLPEEEVERVFRRFERLRPEIPGSGLGLSICKGIVEAHGGTISCENRTDLGACFTIKMPLKGPTA